MKYNTYLFLLNVLGRFFHGSGFLADPDMGKKPGSETLLEPNHYKRGGTAAARSRTFLILTFYSS